MQKVVLSLLLVAMILTGCGGKKVTKEETPLYSKTPEEAVQRAFDLCRAGKYSEAVRLYMNGPQLMKSMPGAAKDLVDKACFTYKGTATRYIVIQKHERGEGVIIEALIYYYPPGSPEDELNPWNITLLKKPGGWLIAT
jgi:hypothetical protein